MNQVAIYRNGSLLQQVKPDSNSSQIKSIMGENSLSLNFVLNSNPEFQYGDYCTVFNELYKINTTPVVKKNGKTFEFTAKLEAEYFDLSKVIFLFFGNDNNLNEAVFTFSGTARNFIDLLVQNANRVSPGWKPGDVISTITKNLSFSSEDCYTVLTRLAEEFDTEFWVEGKTIHLSKRRVVSDTKFTHGRNRGLYTIIREQEPGSKLTTRLYVSGSDKNIPGDYRGGATHLKMTGGINYIENNTAIGLIEGSATFDNIYPHRVGRITALGSDIFTFYDNTLNFDIRQYLLSGLEPKITFTKGILQGYTFKLNKNFNASAKEIRILTNEEEKSIVIPNDTFRPQVGDEYVLTDISMPQSYITAAEAQLTKEATKLLAKISQPQYSYIIDIDPTYMKNRNLSIGVGMEVEIEDTDLNLSQKIGIISCTRNIIDEWKYQIKIADSKSIGNPVAELQNIQAGNSRDIETIQKAYLPFKDNRVTGDLKIKQGTTIYEDSLPVLDGPITDYAPVYINRLTGKLHRSP